MAGDSDAARDAGGAAAGRLGLDPAVVREARALARRAGQPIVELARTHTTVSVERAVLRLAGLDGADDDGMPWVNRLADAVRDTAGLAHGVALPAWDALLAGRYPDLAALARDAAAARSSSGSRRAPTRTGPAPQRPGPSAAASPPSMPAGPSGTR